ncbi:MAG: ACP S-malonyltransferase [Gammaproteobacteria bacterium]|nr:ACP S-malonyltransferase [Gammaproteobacteria bacterium]QOJ31929.1 MAG: ACP S-malonyltransferase [Gammaproteobacteria bacterium]
MAERRIMFVFPGQGSQYRGMGSDLCADYSVARETYAEASEALGYDMARLSFEDPAGEIGLTRHTQPALLTHEVACLRVFQALVGRPVLPLLAAGHSLGEYTALVAAGSLGFADGLRLVRRRGELMGEHGEGGMLALGLDAAAARAIADRHYCQVASINLPEQTVVGGREADLEALAAEMEQTSPRKRAIRLATEGAFHTYLMVEAARRFRETLDATPFAPLAIGVLSNYTASLHDAAAGAIRTRLFFQLFNPVDWVGCLATAMQQGISHMIEFGGGIGSGEGPADKRPNLESIVRKTLKGSNYEAQYAAAINSATLRAAAEQFAA